MQIYLRFSEVPPIFWACEASTKVSAIRTKHQIYLSISEMQPNFCDEVTKDSATDA